MRKNFFAVLSFLILLSACSASVPTVDPSLTATPEGKGLWISTQAFNNGESMPAVYTCQNTNQIGISPSFSWGNVPAGTKSLSLIAEDVDAPLGIFTHWVIYNIPPSIDSLPEGMPVKNHIAGIATQGANSFGRTGYGGPCPPFSQTHRYYFRLYALDFGTSLEEGLDSTRLREKMKDHIVGQAEWIGVYKQP